MRKYWFKNEKLFSKHDVPQHRKDKNLSRKCTTSLIQRQNHNAEIVERSWLCFIFHKLVSKWEIRHVQCIFLDLNLSFLHWTLLDYFQLLCCGYQAQLFEFILLRSLRFTFTLSVPVLPVMLLIFRLELTGEVKSVFSS